MKPAELVSIIEPSGAGKSTLLKIIGAITRPTAGAIYVGNIPIHALKEEEIEDYRKKTIGFMWQLPEQNLLPGLSVEENIQFAHRAAGYPRNKRKQKTTELLKAVGLNERKSHTFGQLSGGEAQQV